MKNLPSDLYNFLETAVDYGRADLFAITLINGQVLRTTSSQVDLTYSGNVYYASLYGAWQRGAIKSAAGFSLQASDVSLTMLADQSVLFPGSTVPIINVALAGILDWAPVTIYTAYWAANEPPNTSRGVETKFVGRILDFQQAGRSKFEFRVGDLLYLLNAKTPPKVIQTGCRHTLYDIEEYALYGTRSGCTLNPASFSASRTVASGSTTDTINLNSAVAASAYAQGFLTFTSGQNAGISVGIKSQPSTTQVVLYGKTPLPLTVGDGFTMYQGCDKTQATCSGRFSNLSHYGGQPYVPNPEFAV